MRCAKGTEAANTGPDCGLAGGTLLEIKDLAVALESTELKENRPSFQSTQRKDGRNLSNFPSKELFSQNVLLAGQN